METQLKQLYHFLKWTFQDNEILQYLCDEAIYSIDSDTDE